MHICIQVKINPDVVSDSDSDGCQGSGTPKNTPKDVWLNLIVIHQLNMGWFPETRGWPVFTPKVSCVLLCLTLRKG